MYETCMKNKCKTCPERLSCDEELKQYKKEHLVWRPFEDLPKILEEKGIRVW